MDQASGVGASCLCAPFPLHPVRACSLASLAWFSRICCVLFEIKTDESRVILHESPLPPRSV